ncbi:IS91 family transposase [candidate division KSB1 bacterium]|nr:IS91 family transposase [candidate division KSB1 bacterium]
MRRANGLEVADIFREYGPAYRATHKLPLQHLKAMSAIESCRTKALGGHLEECDTCGAEVPAYNSCRNRFCPKCNWLAKEKWLLKRKKELLPVSYFHVVLTIPDLLNPLIRYNEKVIYDILFKAGSETLLTLGKDPKHLGADIGFMAILHTWGSNMIDHPHLHCVVPCGGLSDDEMEWLWPNKSKKKKKFFVHVHVISDLFKKKFLHYLDAAYQKGELKLQGQVAHLQDPAAFNKLKSELYGKKWVTFCKQPFGGPEQVLEYLSRYTHRVAISNHRLIKVEGGRVYFKWKNYRKDGKFEETSLDVFEFIRRFLLHVLPKGYFKIRYFGILASRNRHKLWTAQEILGNSEDGQERKNEEGEKSFEEWFFELTGIEAGICPYCKKGRLIRKVQLAPAPS